MRKLLALNEGAPPDAPRVEVILLSRNSADTGLRIFNSIAHHGLAITRAAFTTGAPTVALHPAVRRAPVPVGQSRRRAQRAGSTASPPRPSCRRRPPRRRHDQLRIAFDGDAVIFGDEGERVSQRGRPGRVPRPRDARARGEPLSGGPFRGFLDALHRLQAAFPAGEDAPIRTALVTARSAPAHERVIRTLREWGVRLDEALFLGGRAKGPFLEAFGADIFFDDSRAQHRLGARHVAAGHVPHGVSNEPARTG